MSRELWGIDWPTGKGAPCFAIVALNDVVSEAAPYARWSVGQPLRRVLRWFYERGAAIERIRPEPYRRWVR